MGRGANGPSMVTGEIRASGILYGNFRRSPAPTTLPRGAVQVASIQGTDINMFYHNDKNWIVGKDKKAEVGEYEMELLLILSKDPYKLHQPGELLERLQKRKSLDPIKQPTNVAELRLLAQRLWSSLLKLSPDKDLVWTEGVAYRLLPPTA